MVQTVGIFHLYIILYIIIIYLVRTSSNCACVRITRFVLYENMKNFLLFTMSVLTLIRREASVWKREVGEIFLYTRDTPGLAFNNNNNNNFNDKGKPGRQLVSNYVHECKKKAMCIK